MEDWIGLDCWGRARFYRGVGLSRLLFGVVDLGMFKVFSSLELS